MLNQIVLVGRLVEDVKLNEKNNLGIATIAVPRCFKNSYGVYECDYIPILLTERTGELSSKYVKKGDLVGIKGRVQKAKDEDLKIVAEKVTFLSRKREVEDENNQENN